VTLSIHKLTAGSGYDYLTRQVAALDATEKGAEASVRRFRDSLSSFFAWACGSE
jgi:hypothetical protein